LEEKQGQQEKIRGSERLLLRLFQHANVPYFGHYFLSPTVGKILCNVVKITFEQCKKKKKKKPCNYNITRKPKKCNI
jgi:hypothetical protein